MSLSKKKPLVTVTGASGFIATHLIAQLLEAGYQVRGTVRNAQQSEKYQFLRDLPGSEHLELIEGELLTEGSYDKAIQGAEMVFHTASPYALNVKDPQKDLVDPALKGTENVLQSCLRSPSVRKVILTSSMAAISDEPDNHYTFSELDWNQKSSLQRNPYYFSKTLAEKSAWEFVAKHDHPFTLVSINPYLVIGPSLSPSLNTSNSMLLDFIKGSYPGILDLSWGFVDVRDVAKAHILAAEQEHTSGRYLCVNQTIHMRDIIRIYRENGFEKGYKLPSKDLSGSFGTWMMKCLAHLQPTGTKTYLKTHLGKTMHFDNSKSIKVLGLSYRTLEKTLLEAAGDLIRWKHLEAKNDTTKQYQVRHKISI